MSFEKYFLTTEGAEHHPAATPYDVAAWWCRYILPPGGELFDPFRGSGTMLVAGLELTASKVIGID
jgi:DNA modification methylase